MKKNSKTFMSGHSKWCKTLGKVVWTKFPDVRKCVHARLYWDLEKFKRLYLRSYLAKQIEIR